MNSMQNINNSKYHSRKVFAEHSLKTIHVNRSNPPSLSISALSRILFADILSKQPCSQVCLLLKFPSFGGVVSALADDGVVNYKTIEISYALCLEKLCVLSALCGKIFFN